MLELLGLTQFTRNISTSIKSKLLKPHKDTVMKSHNALEYCIFIVKLILSLADVPLDRKCPNVLRRLLTEKLKGVSSIIMLCL